MISNPAVAVANRSIAPARPPRERLIALADGYANTIQLNDGKLFVPFVPGCSRIENGADVTDTPIEFKGTERVAARVVLTNRVPEVSGTVKAPAESPTGYQVVVFPADASKWTFSSRYLKSTRAASDGTFSIRALPASDRYLAVAVDYLDEGEATDPEFLDRIKPSATSFSLREGEMKTLDLKLIER